MYNLELKFELIGFIVICHLDLYMHKCRCGCVDDLLCCIGMFCDEFRGFEQFWIWGYCLQSNLTQRVKLDNDSVMIMDSTIQSKLIRKVKTVDELNMVMALTFWQHPFDSMVLKAYEYAHPTVELYWGYKQIFTNVSVKNKTGHRQPPRNGLGKRQTGSGNAWTWMPVRFILMSIRHNQTAMPYNIAEFV